MFVAIGASLRDAFFVQNLLVALGLVGLLFRFTYVLTNDRLTIKGEKKHEKKHEKEEKKKDYHLVERSYGSFARTVGLPFDADPEQVKASFANGVLTVTLPKPPEVKAKEKKIQISKG